jgi:diacylglycerol kinase family enzyme
MVSDHGKLRALGHMRQVFKGTHINSPHARLARGERIEVRTDRQFVVYADGDPVGATPATITVRRRVLRVIVPRQG